MEIGLYGFKARIRTQVSCRAAFATSQMSVFSNIKFFGHLLSCGSWHVNNC